MSYSYLEVRDQLVPVIKVLGNDWMEGGEYIDALASLGVQGLGGGYSNDEVFAMQMVKQAAYEAVCTLAFRIYGGFCETEELEEVFEALRKLKAKADAAHE